jgi:hypothetical protein
MGLSRNFNKPNVIDGSMNNRNDHYVDDSIDESDYEEGEVSGYMVQKPLSSTNGINSLNPNVSAN